LAQAILAPKPQGRLLLLAIDSLGIQAMAHCPAAPAARGRPLRAASVVVILGGVAATLAALAAAGGVSFCGGGPPQPRAGVPTAPSGVAMQGKSGRWTGGRPNLGEIARRKMQFPSLNNLKDQYFILWVRSQKVKQWYPLNIISGSEAAKNLKNVGQNEVAKAVGINRLADYQVVRAIGMNLYKQEDEAKKQALNMHKQLQHAKELQWGYKEILNNTQFNDNPSKFLQMTNISMIPPEKELRNLLDDAGDAIGNAGTSITEASDNIKGFFSGIGGSR